ncbi:MAG: CPBP family intramembrane metalloprotease [Clostridiales bacterium]|nr:CPBP family intramembrane metalloprotease [Clostridiales bacterium]
MLDNQIALYVERDRKVSRQKQYRIVGLCTFVVAAGLLLMRILLYYLPIESDLVADAVFSLPLQIGILVVVPFLFYKFGLKKNVREIAAFSSMRKTRWYNLVLAVPIGLCAYGVTIGVSAIWQNILIQLGYTHSSSSLPETFTVGALLLSLFLTCVLPAFCEEFFNRGGLLTTVRGSFPFKLTLLYMGLEFGLFHQNITQVFYTALFGAYMAFLCLKCKSLYPGMIVHFINNACAVVTDYCSTYGFFGGGIARAVNETRAIFVLMALILVAGAFAGLTVLLSHLNSAKRLEKKKDVIASSGFDHKNNRVVLVGEEDKEKVRELGLDKEVYGEKLEEALYKPTLRDNAFFIGTAVLSFLTTIFSFIFGWVV